MRSTMRGQRLGGGGGKCFFSPKVYIVIFFVRRFRDSF